MASRSRLKRRSSVGFSERKRDSMGPQVLESHEGPPSDSMSETMVVGAAEEAAERRQRNLQRRQHQAEVEASGVNSPGLERQGQANRRHSGGGIQALSNAQLAEHYQHCLKLSAENKVSTKNAFNLQLIDWMAQAIGKKKAGAENGVDMSDFQIAAGTLDASTKIYGFRVDVVYNETFKLASGLTQSGKQKTDENLDGSNLEGDEAGDGEAEGDPSNPDAPKKRKRIKKSSTIEKNMKNINIGKMELEFDVDPLFKKTTSQFDVAGGGGNQFLASLRLRDDGTELLMDSESILECRAVTTPRKAGEAQRLQQDMFAAINDLKVCPEELRDFSFIKWTLDEEDRLNESISASQEERDQEAEARNEDHAFDAFAVPEPVDYIDTGNIEGAADHGDVDDDYFEATEVSERALGQHLGSRPTSRLHGFTANLEMTPADMLSVLTTAPLEYSYFDHGKLGAWAGPKHWKFKAMPRNRQEDEGNENRGGRKKKTLESIDYEEFEDYIEGKLAKITDLLKTPTKSVKLVEKTMKSWNRERATLPEDLHYSGHELVRLKLVEKIIVTANSVAEVAEVHVDEDVEDYDYDNAGDNDGYCPEIDGQEDDYGEGDQGLNGTTSESLEDRLGTGSEAGGEYGGDNLVEAPKTVDRAALQIGYAKTAKKVDMKRIKETAWKILTQDKENRSAQSPEKQEDNSGSELVQETSFHSLYHTLKQPNKLPRTMSENLSVPLAFIALLHLCNEHTLSLESLGEEFGDFSIVKD